MELKINNMISGEQFNELYKNKKFYITFNSIKEMLKFKNGLNKFDEIICDKCNCFIGCDNICGCKIIKCNDDSNYCCTSKNSYRILKYLSGSDDIKFISLITIPNNATIYDSQDFFEINEIIISEIIKYNKCMILDGKYIKYNDANYEISKLLIKQDLESLQFINQTPEICKFAFDLNHRSIQYMVNQPEEYKEIIYKECAIYAEYINISNIKWLVRKIYGWYIPYLCGGICWNNGMTCCCCCVCDFNESNPYYCCENSALLCCKICCCCYV